MLNNKHRLGKLKNDQPSEEQIAARAKNREAVARSRKNSSAAGMVATDRRERNSLAARVYRAKKKGCMPCGVTAAPVSSTLGIGLPADPSREEQLSPVSTEGASTLNTFHCSQCRPAG